MKKVGFLVLLLVACCGLARAQKASELFKAQIPIHWEVLSETYGDLNKDSIADAAVIIQEKGEGTGESGKKRTILIFFKGWDGSYSLATRGETAIMSDRDGGMMGDPFQQMIIKKGVLILSFWGGARDKWGVVYRYRYQYGDFFLIGASNKGGNGIQTYRYDYNLSTGKMIIAEKDMDNSKNNKKETKVVKMEPQPKLKSFTPWSMNFGGSISY